MTQTFIIAIDGPAASGKGTLARKLATYFDFAHLDTGKLYRALGYLVLHHNGNPDDAEMVLPHVSTITPSMLNRPELIAQLADERVANAASHLASIPRVRQALLDFQRQFATTPPDDKKGAVLDGRDVGTIICPEAPVKLFIKADVTIRAERRYKELRERGQDPIYQEVLKELEIRDHRDRSRKIAPLRPADDSKIIDTSHFDADKVFQLSVAWVKRRLGKIQLQD